MWTGKGEKVGKKKKGPVEKKKVRARLRRRR
jgi:hypothetical protein